VFGLARGELAVNAKLVLVAAVALLPVGCGGPSEPTDPPPTAPRPTVFDPLTSTIDRAQGVQQTVDQQAAEQRRRLEDAER
jgi:hypothetical protein